jgi:NitT/TauT family transport system ATP-binding protein
MAFLSVKDLNKKFSKEGAKPLTALDSINLDIEKEEFISLVGPSGCGKTTLLRIIAGLEEPTSGEILLEGNEIRGPDPERGMVFQEYSLFPWLNIIDNISFGLEMKGIGKEERRKAAAEYIDIVNLKGFENSYPHELSGGMRQRVAIARALANAPKLLLMDEPFGALDAQTRNRMQNELLDIHEKTRKTVIFVTHSVDEAVYLSDRVVVLSTRPGRIREIIEIDLPEGKKRERTDPEFIRLRKYILSLISDNPQDQ